MPKPKTQWIGQTLGNESQADFRIYPSLLDKYQDLLSYEEEAEQPWNKVGEKAFAEGRNDGKDIGDYILSPEEMYDKIEQELIDTINRAPRTPSAAADRGTALNEIVDCLLMGKACDRADMTIATQRVGAEPISIRADYDGFTFDFDVDLCRRLRDQLQGAMCQVYLQAPIATAYGNVLLYGYADYWLRDKIIDLKTTSDYSFGKYARKWQRFVYPYCAVESGLVSNVSEFVYLAAQLGKGKVIKGSIYPEAYTYDHQAATNAIKGHIESFLGWLMRNRDKITDKKIFNQQNDAS